MTTVFAIVMSGWLAASNANAPIRSSDSVNVVQVVARFHAALASGDSAVALGLLDRDAPAELLVLGIGEQPLIHA